MERAFRETKAALEVRPVFHHLDDTTISHIVACFLALRLEARGVDVAWPELLTDLADV